MKVVVTGSREGVGAIFVQARLRELKAEHPDLEVLVGDARGVDEFAQTICMWEEIPCRVFKADWRPGGTYNPRAGHERNQAMIDEKPDKVISFWNGSSTGTKDCMDRAFAAGIRVEVHRS